MTRRRPFGPVERSTVSEQVRDDIQRRIVSGELPPGSRLPAERVLAEQFGVARSSIREAIQGLMALDVIERRGNRSYVTEHLPDSELPPSDDRTKSVREVIEARRVLESLLFELAAYRATARDRSRALALARRPVPATLEEFLVVEREFHAGVANACGNPVLVEVYGRVLDALATSTAAGALILGIEPGSPPGEAIVAAGVEHLRIAEAYAARDVPAMLGAADSHLGRAAWGAPLSRRVRRPLPEFDEAVTRTVGM